MSSPKTTPVFDRAVALLQDFDNDQMVWLFRDCSSGEDDSSTDVLELLWAERLEKESYREALSRELDWQFGLSRKKDYIVCSTPRLNLIVHPIRLEVISREQALEDGFGVLEVYPIQLFGRRSRQLLNSREDVRFEFLPALRKRAKFTPQTELLIDCLAVPEID